MLPIEISKSKQSQYSYSPLSFFFCLESLIFKAFSAMETMDLPDSLCTAFATAPATVSMAFAIAFATITSGLCLSPSFYFLSVILKNLLLYS